MAAAMTPVVSAYWQQGGAGTKARIEAVTKLDMGPWSVINPHTAAAIRKAAFSFCHETNATTDKDLAGALSKLRAELHAGVVEHGESIPELTRRVKGVFAAATTWRARAIAMTEATRAVHAGQLAAAVESGVVAGMEWLISSDACPRCKRVYDEARMVKLGDPFAIAGKHPDYATVRHPPLHPNDRCTVVEVLTPEYGGPADPQWSQPVDFNKGVVKAGDTPPKEPPARKPTRPPQITPEPPVPRKPVAPMTPPKDVPDRLPTEPPSRPVAPLHQPPPVKPETPAPAPAVPAQTHVPAPGPKPGGSPTKYALKKAKKLAKATEAAKLAPLAPSPVAPPTPAPPVSIVAEVPKATTGPLAAFPADPSSLIVVKALGGSTGAQLVKDPHSGALFVRKQGANADHLREEDHADRLYRAAGVLVPDSRLYELKGGPMKLSRYEEGGRTLAQLEKSDPAAYKAAVLEARKGFAVDALLGNWDAVGLGADNMLVTKSGEVMRIDNGGSLRYRAQGQKKTADQWDAHPDELWTMRDPARNASAAGVFGPIKFAEIADQVEALHNFRVPEGIPPELRKTLDARLGQMRDVARVGRTFLKDDWTDDYTDGLLRHTVGIRKAGISERMPTAIKKGADGKGSMVDQDGRPFDHLRGKDSITNKLYDYMSKNGGSPKAFEQYASDQAGSSWSSGAVAFKSVMMDARPIDRDKFFWGSNDASAETMRKKGEKFAKTVGTDPEGFRQTVMMQHAFTRELLAKADIDKKKGPDSIELMRTESDYVMGLHGAKPGDKGLVIKRGLAESTSIFAPVEIKGGELTVQTVPIHRVVVTYWQARTRDGTSGCLMGDGENEFVAMLEGARAEYRARPSKSATATATAKSPPVAASKPVKGSAAWNAAQEAKSPSSAPVNAPAAPQFASKKNAKIAAGVDKAKADLAAVAANKAAFDKKAADVVAEAKAKTDALKAQLAALQSKGKT